MQIQKKLDKNKLLRTLTVDCSCFEQKEDFMMEQMSLANSILTIAGVDQEKEYALCRNLAEKILGDKIPQPQEYELE